MNTPKVATLRIIRPSSREQTDLLGPKLASIEAAGFHTVYQDLPADPHWAYAASSAKSRAQALAEALLEPTSDAVLCARGGYGASDLLPLLPWDQLAKAKPKLLVGFSDISALHSALYSKLGWPGLHGPMPATTLWGQHTIDTQALLATIQGLQRQQTVRGQIHVEPIGQHKNNVIKNTGADLQGKLFGGCFAVLTNLIGTPYFPRSLRGHIVFLEDTGEHPARLVRFFHQWLYSGVLEGVVAIVFGHLNKLGDKIPDCADFVYERLAAECPVPFLRSADFGHTSPNLPLLIGAPATIDHQELAWQAQGLQHLSQLS